MMKAKIHVDALGNPIIVGGLYGYSASKSGHATTVIGRVRKIGAQRVSLDVIKRRNFLWGEATESRSDEAPTTSANSCILFPLSESLAEQQNQEV
jgi:hypothetical protein